MMVKQNCCFWVPLTSLRKTKKLQLQLGIATLKVCQWFAIFVLSLMSICQWMYLFTKKCAAIQGQLRKLYRIRKYLTVTACKSLIQALVIPHLDYCCSLLLGTKKVNIDHLQHLQNCAARFIFDIPQYESAKPYLQQLHWLPVQERIHFRVLTYVFKCLNSQAPRYLSELLQIH